MVSRFALCHYERQVTDHGQKMKGLRNSPNHAEKITVCDPNGEFEMKTLPVSSIIHLFVMALKFHPAILWIPS